jgi:methionyl-tRNA formyltransferase
LLPRWRGAAPIQAAILHGDEETGVTIMKMDRGLDTGPILSQRSLKILPKESTEKLADRLSITGADLLIDTLPGYLDGNIVPVDQNQENVTYATMIKKEDGKLNFKKTAIELERQIRAFDPWPGCFIEVGSDRIKIIDAEVEKNLNINVAESGVFESFPIIGTTQGALKLKIVQPAGKKPMSGDIFLRGYRNWECDSINED